MGGARLGHKIVKSASRIGKKVVKGAAIGAAIGGALLVGGSYHLGKKEQTKQTDNQNRIRSEAEAELKRREDEIAASGKAEARRNAAERARLLMEREHQDSFTVGDSGLQQQDPLAVRERARDGRLVAAEGPQQDPLDYALAQAQRGQSAAASFESKKIGGLKQKLTPSNPFKKKSP
tara:strand:+ start:1707 stop:2237 length:531 start_codon:yes stop_codon:yes gene_type:complete